MHRNLASLASVLVLAGLAATPAPSRAAESYASCTGFIDSLPAVISTQGVWCLRADLSTAIGAGPAISVQNNNITIDCNDFKLGGLAAGPETMATGISSGNQRNITVRRCAVRGFRVGISLTGDEGGGHLVEKNRLDGNRRFGINVQGDSTSTIRDNRVMDTGGDATATFIIGITARGTIINNTIDRVTGTSDNATVRGILTGAASVDSVIAGNRVRGLTITGTGSIIGITAPAPQTQVLNNLVVANTADPGDYGIYTSEVEPSFMGGNRVSGFATPFFGLPTNAGANYSN